MFVHQVDKFFRTDGLLQIKQFSNYTISRRHGENITKESFRWAGYRGCRIFAPMKKIYCLSTCSTCNRILKEIQAEKKGFTLQDIKTEKITVSQLEELKEKAGSYEALFSRRAIRYKEMGLKDKRLTEKDYRRLILGEYTFLKRPVILSGDELFVGSEKATVERLKKAVR